LPKRFANFERPSSSTPSRSCDSTCSAGIATKKLRHFDGCGNNAFTKVARGVPGGLQATCKSGADEAKKNGHHAI